MAVPARLDRQILRKSPVLPMVFASSGSWPTVAPGKRDRS